MATDTADDKAEKPGEPKTTETSSTPPAARPSASDVRSEWIASDSRGPLEKADDDGRPLEAAHEPVASNETPTQAETKPDTSHAPAPLPKSATADTPAASEPAPSVAAVPAPEPEKRSLLPIAAGLVIGAIIGAGSAAIVYANHGGSTAGTDVATLSSRVDALEKRPSSGADVTKLEGTVSDLSNQVAALKKDGGAASGGSAASVDLAPLQQKIAALQTSLDALKAQGGDTKTLQARIATLETDVAGAKRESSAAQAGMAGVEDRTKVLAGKVMVPALAVVADSLVQQIDQGQPYAAQVDALTALNADPTKLAVLRENAAKGVPSAKALAAKFEPLAEPIVATAHKAPANAGFVDRLKSGMFSMVSVRNADDTSGTDLPSRVAHIKVALAHDDIADALATFNLLPADAKAKGEAWAALAKTSADALAAARALQHDAIVALAAKKS